MTQDTTQLPTSRYFHLERVAPGVYAAIVVPGTGAWGNAGIVDLGDATLVVDTFMTLSAARELRAAAETLTGRAVGYVVNTHYHADHVLGNQVFDGALIIATEQTRALIAERNGRLLAGVKADPLGEEIDALEREAQAETDEMLRADLLHTAAEYRALARDVAELELRLPDVTFVDQVVLHGSARTAELLTYGGGHTASDAFVYLPEARVVFTGDLVSVRRHPPFYGSPHGPRAWAEILSRIEALDVETVVPGHGSVATREALATVRRYFADLMALAGELLARGATADELAQAPIPAACEAWTARDAFQKNMRFLHGYPRNGSAEPHG
jgi:glyoxylase-like metal-dependent hydrolase (beta-lactamase superfamily II)